MGATSSTTAQKSKTDFYCWRPDNTDLGDEYKRYKRNIVSTNLTRVVNNVAHCGPVLDQGELGSCTANAIAGAYTYRYNLENNTLAGSATEFLPSRLFVYYNERRMEGNVKTDAGAEIKDGIKSIKKLGACPESMWPYDISKFTEKPPTECYDEAKECHHATEEHRVVKTLDSLKGCLETGRVFAFGFVVFESFEDQSKWTGAVMPLPAKGEKVLGGHAVLCVGYDDDKKSFLVRNSWGAKWGLEGNFYMPYEFMTGTFNLHDFDLKETHWKSIKDKKTTDLETLDETKSEEDVKENGESVVEQTEGFSKSQVATKKKPEMNEALCSDLWSIDVTFDKAE